MNGALTGATTIGMGGALTGATTIAMGGALTGATNIVMNGALTGATSVGMGGALTGVTTSAFSGEMTFSADDAKIKHTGTTKLTISSSGVRPVLIESVTFTGGEISTATTIAMNGALTGATTIGMGGALTGATTIGMSGALTGATSIGMGGALTGVTNLAVSGTISTPTTIAASSTITTSNFFVSHKSYGIKSGSISEYTGTTIASWHGVIKRTSQTFTNHAYKNYDITWSGRPVSLQYATIVASICGTSFTTAFRGLSVRVYSRSSTQFSLQVFNNYVSTNFGNIDIYICYIIIFQS